MRIASQHLGSTHPRRALHLARWHACEQDPERRPSVVALSSDVSRGTTLLKVRTELPSHSRFPAYFCQMVIPLPSYAFNVTIII